MKPVSQHFESVISVQWPIRDSVDLRIGISKLNMQPFMQHACEVDRSIIGTIISELGTNIVKYSEYGHIKITHQNGPKRPFVEIRAEDKGPGIADQSLALQDHFSTGNTLGLGLPGVRRMADTFELTSSPTGTTVIVTKELRAIADIAYQSTGNMGSLRPFRKPFEANDRVIAVSRPARPEPYMTSEIGAATLPMSGQVRSGDWAIIVENDNYLSMIMMDITGHGDRAFALGKLVKERVEANVTLGPKAMMAKLHETLIGTIGAAAGIFQVDRLSARFSYVGVGNTGIARAIGERWTGISRDGLLGTRLPSLTEQQGIIMRGDAFVMWTDGIPERLGRLYVERNWRDGAQKVARELVKSLGKPHDDAGCIVFRRI